MKVRKGCLYLHGDASTVYGEHLILIVNEHSRILGTEYEIIDSVYYPKRGIEFLPERWFDQGSSLVHVCEKCENEDV